MDESVQKIIRVANVRQKLQIKLAILPYTDTISSTDSIMLGVWQSSHQNTILKVTGMTQPKFEFRTSKVGAGVGCGYSLPGW